MNPTSILCPQCKEENPAKFRLCGYCGAALASAAAAPPSHEVRRTVTILFSDLRGSTALGERLDSEAMHEVKERYFGAMAAEIKRHGGKIEKYIGDAIMAVFGLPLPHEDDALRAVRAAAGMQAALRAVNRDLMARYGVELANRTGVNTGEVVANDDPRADQKLATGDCVNVAARLEQAAPENEVYLGEITYRLVRDAVEVEAVAPLELKGKSDKVAAFRLVSAKGLEGVARRHDTPLVGRDEELVAIDHALEEVRSMRAVRMVTLIGDAGIGKSRLAREVVERAGADARVLRGRCLPYGDGITFWPMREMASEAADIRFDDSTDAALAKLSTVVGDTEVSDRIAAALGLSAAAFPLHEIYWAARKFFAALAGERPLVALVDDIHWAEPAFLDLLEYVLAGKSNAAILLLATSRQDLLEKRPDWGIGPSAVRLILRPLTDGAAALVAGNLLGTSGLPADIVERIVTAAEGNPLYVEQMLSMLVDSGALRQEDGRWVRAAEHAALVIPPTIKALLEARIGQLAREERLAIEPASVIGLQFPAPAVASLAPVANRSGIATHLENLERKQFVRALPSEEAEGVYRFHHHLVRDTVYGGLLKRARATLHVDFVRWADEINADRGRALEYEEILGYHLEQAHRYLCELGPLDEAALRIGHDASRRLGNAARRAFSRGDTHAAHNLYRRAIDVLPQDHAARLPLLPELGEVLLEMGQFAEARQQVDLVLRSADRGLAMRLRAAANILGMLVRLHSGEPGSWAEATLQLTTETIPELEREGAHGELARAWRLVALVQQTGGRLGAATESIAKVVAHARLAGDDRLVARSALGLSLSGLYGPMPVPAAIEQCLGLLAGGLCDRQVEGLILSKLAHLRALNGELDEARSLYARARAQLRDGGSSVRGASISLDVVAIELLAGDPAAAEREVRADFDLLVGMGETFFVPTLAALLGRAVRDQGRDAEALELTRKAESTAAEDDVDAQVLWRCVRAPMLARSGSVVEAEALAREALRRARATDVPALQGLAGFELASVLALAGQQPEAVEVCRQALGVYTVKGDLPSMHRCRDAIGALSPTGPG